MIYICAALECASIFEITVGLERGRKETNYFNMFICVAVYMVYFAVTMHFQLSGAFAAFGYVVMFVCIKHLYQEGFLRSLAITVLSAIFIATIELLILFIVSTVIQSDEEHMGVFEFLVTIMTFIVSYLLSKSSINKVLLFMEKWNSTYVIVAILSLMVFAPEITLRFVHRLNVADYIYLAFFILLIWLLIVKVQGYKLESKMRRQYFEAYSDVIVQIRRRQHKIKNQINAAYSMFRIYDTYDELVANQKKYLSRILDYELPTDAIILDVPSITALIYEKINEALEQSIQVKTSFTCSMSNSVVSDVVWVDLIGTLFDNAIEALNDYDGPRKIWLEIGQTDKTKIFVRISNTFWERSVNEIHCFFKMGYSTKGNDRGIGLYNVKKIVNKYNGEIIAINTERDDNNVITFEIII